MSMPAEALASVGGEQVDRLGGVYRRAAADGDEAVPRPLSPRVPGGLVEAVVGRLHVDAVEDLRLDAVPGQRLGDPLRQPGRMHVGISDDQYPLDAELGNVEADLVDRARPELQRRRAPGVDRLLDARGGLAHR